MKRTIRKIVTILVIFCVFLGTTPNMANASQATRDKIKQAEEDKKKTESELGEANKNVDETNSRISSLEKELKGLNGDLEALVERIDELNQDIEKKESQIKKTQEKLDQAREREKIQYESMKKRIQFMYEDSETLYLEILFQAKSFSELLTLSNYVDDLATYDKKKFEEYKQARITTEDLEAELQSEKVDLEVLKKQAEEEKAGVMTVIDKTAKKTAEYEDILDEYEKQVLAYEEKLKEQEANLEALNKQLQEEIRLSQLSANSVWRDISEVTFDEGDRYLLANLIYCEAGGEPYEGQVAVGAVVMNRVLSPVYPSTVTGVIYQKSQFSPAGSGRLAYALSVDKATASCYRAADEAMSGATNVGNCVYFRTPIPGLNGQQIGHHIFY